MNKTFLSYLSYPSCFFRFSFCLLFAFASFTSPEEAVLAKRLQAHLLIHDIRSATLEMKQALTRYPHSKILQEAAIRVLAKAGEEKEMLALWQNHIQEFPEAEKNHSLMEAMAWGVIEKGSHSLSPMTRAMSTLAGLFSQHVRGVHILHDALKDKNTFVRGIAVQLSGNLNDAKLQKEMIRLFHEEKSWVVRLKVIQALGNMQIRSLRPDLEKIIAKDSTPAEEKAVAIEALVGMLETVPRDELLRLAKSPRMGLRLLACEAVAKLDLYQEIDAIIPLVQDHSPAVRKAALEALGILRVESHQEKEIAPLARMALQDHDAEVAISAAWLLTLLEPLEGQQAFKIWLQHEAQDTRLLAAAALNATGKYGFPLTWQAFQAHKDPYVRLNLAFGLLSQRLHTQEACEVLYRGLMQQEERWMWQEEGLFRILAPSIVKHQDEIPQYPEVVNQLVRFELIQTLAQLQFPGAQEAMKQFVRKKVVGVTGIAVALLLTEGEEDALDIVRMVMDESAFEDKIHAALILALWGRDETVITLLQKAYESADRSTQEHILEGLGRIGVPTSIPFLADRLQEHSQNLRIIAASSLLQALNH